MTALEEIKKALEGDMNTGLTAIDRLRFIVGGVPDFDPITVEDADWLISALESLQRENEELRKDKDHIAAEKAGIAKNAHNNVDYWKSQAEAAEAEVKRLRDRYERWMPVTETPPAGMHPDALLHFYCISDEVDGDESPEYWKTDTWQDKPADAVYWCAIVSPLGPHETTFIARTALASTGGEHNGN